jgi:hypothetical protein
MSKQVDWPSVFLAQARSGLSIAEFCRKRGIDKQQYYYHRRASGNAVARRKSVESFLPLLVTEKEERFLELLCGGLVMRIPTSLASVELKRIIAAVKEVQC